MKTVFLSRPTWIDEKHQKGLFNFTTMLKARGLDARTVGVTDQPNLSPMDEVIHLMRKCLGAIVLGYPQISVDAGFLKDQSIQSRFCLATEWNHMETALAHAMGLPILLIHDVSVVRGVFERGAANAFLHSVDFGDPSWCLSQGINGAVDVWAKRLCPATVTGTSDGSLTKRLKWGCYEFTGKEGLYCPACYENKGKMIPVPRLDGGHYKCPVCKAELS